MPDLPHSTVPGATTRSNRETLFGLRLHLVGRFCENLRSARDPAQCKPACPITWLV